MTQRTALCGSTAILIALSGTAQADVTGAEVWANWKAAAESVGQVLTPGSESQNGNVLTITDLQMSMDLPEVDVAGTIGLISFTDRGDGTVGIAMSPNYDVTINLAPKSGEKVDIKLAAAQDGLSMIASGSPAEINYDFAAPSVNVGLASLMVDGEAIDAKGEIALSDLDGQYVVSQGDMTQVSSVMAASRMLITAAANEPGGSGTFAMNLDYADITGSSNGSLMAMADPAAISKALAAGMSTASTLGHGAASFALDFMDGSDTFNLDGTADSGAIKISMNADALSYGVSNTGLDIKFSGSEIPLPEVAFAVGEIGTSFLMPVAPSDTPGNFGLGFTLRDLTVSDMIWGMVDAGRQLPHDPATLVIDLSGKANWLIDIFDPENAEKMDMEMPAELHALDINAMQLSIAGAELTGNGAFTFNMKDLSTFDGMPAPTGAIDLKLVGGNGLIDKLIAMGLLPEEQAMGARMMLGLFARPGDGPDTLTSKIEVDGATGAVSANGQRLQ